MTLFVFLLLPPITLWFFSLGVFLITLKKERPGIYSELGIASFFKKKHSDDAARIIDFFWHQKHQRLDGKTALAGKILTATFYLCIIYMLVILWLGWIGRIH